MKYKLYFEIYGKKMQAVIDAASPADAEYKLRGKIIINKVVLENTPEVKNPFEGLPGFENVFGAKK